MDCHFLLQEIFLTQGSNLGLLNCRWTLYRLSYMGSPHGSLVPKMLGTVAIGDKETLKKSEEGSNLSIRGKVEGYMGDL